MANLWHELPPGPQGGLEVVYVVVEIPKRSRNKFVYDLQGGFIKLDRVLHSSLHYPGDYGFVPRTLYDDGDPVDVLVMTNEPTAAGCIIEARPLGIFRLLDRGLHDDKVLAVPATDPLFDAYRELSDVPAHFLDEVRHFFSVYKNLQQVQVVPGEWADRAAALADIERACDHYARQLRTQR